MNIEELEDTLEQALARIKLLEDALLQISLHSDASQPIVDIALEALDASAP